MPNLETLEKQDTPPPSKSKSFSNRWRWQWLIAPLMGLSIVFHIALLFVPLPAPAPPEERDAEEAEVEEEEEEEAIDILSLSDIEVPEPPAEPPPEQAPQTSTASPPDAVPPPPDPTQVPETLPESTLDDQPPEETGLEETPPGNSFDPARQQALLGQTGGINSEFDQTEYFPVYAWNPVGNPAGYLASWDSQRHACFFSSISEMNFQLIPGADRLKFLARNYALIVNEDLPRTFPTQDIVQESDGYCGEDFFTVYENGVPAGIYVSAIGVGRGSPPASVVLIFWVQDPRS